MRNVKSGLALLLLMVSQVTSKGVFKLELIEFTNDKGLLDDRTCCAGQMLESDNSCTQECNTYFKICVKHFQREITTDDCSFGEFVTEPLGNNSLRFPRSKDSFTNPLEFPVDFAWPGDFSLIIDAIHESPSHTQGRLIASFRGSSRSAPPEDWSTLRWNSTNIQSPQSIQFKYKVQCGPAFFGAKCNTMCEARDDHLGHYECGINGEKVCKQGWKGPYCGKAICLEGCSGDHGTCSQPNECSCRVGWQGRLCNQCLTYPDCEHGFCQTAFQCSCHEGWGGLYCNQDLNYCTNNKPCENGGTCTNTGEGSYTCTCAEGFQGNNCEHEVDNCLSKPCKNNGVCKDVGNDYICQCPQGYAGAHCEVSAARCEQRPCANNGRCEPIGSSYRCHCAEGWTGVNCGQEKNECMVEEHDTPRCLNDGRCIDKLNSYTCSCLAGFSGDRCEVDNNECAGENPCQNGGRCVDGPNKFICKCIPGFMGDLCETNIDDCDMIPCANGGSCVDRVNNFQCYCALGYAGRFCNEQVNECASSPCTAGRGTCEDLVNGYKCHCSAEWHGRKCEYRIGETPPSTTTQVLRSTAQPSTRKPVATSGGKIKTGSSVQGKTKEGGEVELTQEQLILLICLGSGIPMCLLLILVSILLYRRCRRKVDSEEARQNAINGMNNRIHNPVVTGGGKTTNASKADLYEYSTTEKKVINELESPAPALPLDYKNTAAAQASSKVLHKEMIKDINTTKERQLNAINAARQQQSVTAAEQPYLDYYHQERHCSSPSSRTSGIPAVHNSNNSNIDNSHSTNSSAGIPTVCSTVLHTIAPSNDRTSLSTTFRHSQESHPSHHQHRQQHPHTQTTVPDVASDYNSDTAYRNRASSPHYNATTV